MNQVMEMDQTYVANTYNRFPIEIVRGQGATAWDESGKAYTDLGSGIAVNIFGYADETWQETVKKQLSVLPHTSNLYYSEPCALLAKMLCERTGLKKVFFGNSGAEANECAIKTARKWSRDTYGEGRHTIITLKNSFHGRTIATLSATGQDTFHTDFGPFPGGFLYADPADPAALDQMAASGCAAIMIEVVQGEGGVCPLSEAFLAAVAAACEKYGLLLIVDEVQTGNGRSGALYAYMNVGLKPDIVTTAKGLGGGLPLGACMLGEKVKDTLGAGKHGSTFGGNPIACAGAASILARIDDKLLAGVKAKSAYIVGQLTGAKGVQGVTGMGLMLGVATEKPAREVALACMEKGVLVLTAKNKVRLLPPLTIPDEQLKTAIDVLKEVCAK